MENKVIAKEYVDKNYISKKEVADDIKGNIEIMNLCIELQKMCNNGLNDNNPEKYYFAKKILKEMLQRYEK